MHATNTFRIVYFRLFPFADESQTQAPGDDVDYESDPWDGIDEKDRYVKRKEDQNQGSKKKTKLNAFLPPLLGDSDGDMSDVSDEDGPENVNTSEGSLKHVHTQALRLATHSRPLGSTSLEVAVTKALPQISEAVGAVTGSNYYHCSGLGLDIFPLPDNTGLSITISFPYEGSVDNKSDFTIKLSNSLKDVEYSGIVPEVIEPLLAKVKKYLNMYHAYMKIVHCAALNGHSVTKFLVDSWPTLTDLRGLPGFSSVMTLLFNSAKPPTLCPEKEISALKWFPVVLLQAVFTLTQMKQYAPSKLGSKRIWTLCGKIDPQLLPSDTFGTIWDQNLLFYWKKLSPQQLQAFVNRIFRSVITREKLPFCDYSANMSVLLEAREDQRKAGGKQMALFIEGLAKKALEYCTMIENNAETISNNLNVLAGTDGHLKNLVGSGVGSKANQLKENVKILEQDNKLLKAQNATLADKITELQEQNAALNDKANITAEEKKKLVESGQQFEKVQQAVEQALRRSCRTTRGRPAVKHQ